MAHEPLELKGIQLALARAIAAIELKFTSPSREWSEDYEREEDAYEKSQAIVRQLERDGGLHESSTWRQRVPLIQLYDFSPGERDLLLDLDDAGGIQITRQHDRRFSGLGCGNGGKKAVGESAQSRWKVQLTERGEALVKALRKEPNNAT